jgi:hypothetical protein
MNSSRIKERTYGFRLRSLLKTIKCWVVGWFNEFERLLQGIGHDLIMALLWYLRRVIEIDMKPMRYVKSQVSIWKICVPSCSTLFHACLSLNCKYLTTEYSTFARYWKFNRWCQNSTFIVHADLVPKLLIN